MADGEAKERTYEQILRDVENMLEGIPPEDLPELPTMPGERPTAAPTQSVAEPLTAPAPTVAAEPESEGGPIFRAPKEGEAVPPDIWSTLDAGKFPPSESSGVAAPPLPPIPEFIIDGAGNSGGGGFSNEEVLRLILEELKDLPERMAERFNVE